MPEVLTNKSLIVKQVRSNGDKSIHEKLKIIAEKKGLPLFRFLDIELGRVVEKYKDLLN